MAVADAELIGGGDRGADPRPWHGARRFPYPRPSQGPRQWLKTIEHPVPWVFLGGDPRQRGQCDHAVAAEENSRLLSAPLPVATLDQQPRGIPSAKKPLALAFDRAAALAATSSSSRLAASGRFGVSKEASGMSLIRSASTASAASKPNRPEVATITGSRHDVLRRPALEPRDDGIDGCKLRHHPDR